MSSRLVPHDRRQTVLFPESFLKPVVAVFDEPHVTSDAGAVFLHRIERRSDLISKLARCVSDRRDGDKSRHSIDDMLRQRILGICLGYFDCNDAAKIGRDPIFRMCASRSPIGDDRLASQPTLSRFENSVTMTEAAKMQSRLIETVIESCRRRYGRNVKRIAIDIDPTDDPTHGSQQLTFFNGYYDNWCYLPLMGFLSFDKHPEQHLFAAVLRPGDAPATLGATELLKGVVPALRDRFRKAKILVRFDGAYATPAILETLESLGVDYVINMPKNAVLKRKAEDLMRDARRMSARDKATAAVYGECRYAAKSWNERHRRIVIKAEVTRLDGRDPRDNPRFVVTNLRGSPKHVYEVYRRRGDCENRIKEMKLDLASGRTSCTSFVANQLRLTMSAAAFFLMQELRMDAAGTDCEGSRVDTLRWRILKIGARVVETARRIVLHLPASYPWRATFDRLALT